MKNRNTFPAAPPADGRCGTIAHGETIAPCGNSRSARREPDGVSPSIRRRRAVPPLPAPHAASRSTGSDTSRATAFRTTRHRFPLSRACHCAGRHHATLYRLVTARLACGRLPGRGLSPARPARMRNRSPRSPCLGRSRPFGNRKKEKRHKKREPVQNGQAPAYSP